MVVLVVLALLLSLGEGSLTVRNELANSLDAIEQVDNAKRGGRSTLRP
jgi:hypothetical protein